MELVLREISPGSARVGVSICDQGVQLTFGREPSCLLSPSEISGWQFSGQVMGLAYRGFHPGDEDPKGEQNLLLRGTEPEIRDIERQFNALRMQFQQDATSDVALQIIRCPECELLINVTETAEAEVHYCPECQAMFSATDTLTRENGELFNFCDDGLFALLGKQSRAEHWQHSNAGYYGFRSFRDEVLPTAQKIVGHVLWGCLWLLLLAGVWYPYVWGWVGTEELQTWLVWLVYCLMGLVAVHVVFTGYYVTGMVMTRSISTFLRRYSYESVASMIRLDQLSEAEEAVGESRHPGMLANLALGYARAGEREKAQELLERARRICPGHPALESMLASLCSS